MKRKSLLLVIAVVFLLSGCFVYSFYPLYTEDDLFPNDLLLGEWVDEDSTIWKFEHRPKTRFSMFGNTNVDSTCYNLTIKEKGDDKFSEDYISVRIVLLEDYYFLDFYLEDHQEQEFGGSFGIYLIPVHVFAKLEVNDDSSRIKYFNPEWLGELIQQNKIRIHHEESDDRILLTAKPKELQKFVLKYVNSEEAFEEDYTVNLIKK